jgi:hypothetical protein
MITGILPTISITAKSTRPAVRISLKLNTVIFLVKVGGFQETKE